MNKIDIAIGGAEPIQPLSDSLRETLLSPVKDLSLSGKLRFILEQDNFRVGKITNLAEAVTLTEEGFLKLKKAGQQTLAELKEVVALSGLALSTEFYAEDQKLSRNQALILIRYPEIELSRVQYPDPLEVVKPTLKAAMRPLFRRAGRDVVTWPLPDTVQDEMTRQLVTMQAALAKYQK